MKRTKLISLARIAHLAMPNNCRQNVCGTIKLLILRLIRVSDRFCNSSLANFAVFKIENEFVLMKQPIIWIGNQLELNLIDPSRRLDSQGEINILLSKCESQIRWPHEKNNHDIWWTSAKLRERKIWHFFATFFAACAFLGVGCNGLIDPDCLESNQKAFFAQNQFSSRRWLCTFNEVYSSSTIWEPRSFHREHACMSLEKRVANSWPRLRPALSLSLSLPYFRSNTHPSRALGTLAADSFRRRERGGS